MSGFPSDIESSIAIGVCDRYPVFGQFAGEVDGVMIGKNDRRSRVLQHVLDSRPGICRVQRYIIFPRLQNGKYGNNCRQTVFEQNSNRFCTITMFAQEISGYPIRIPIHLGKALRLPGVFYGNPLRIELYLTFKTFYDGLLYFNLGERSLHVPAWPASSSQGSWDFISKPSCGGHRDGAGYYVYNRPVKIKIFSDETRPIFKIII